MRSTIHRTHRSIAIAALAALGLAAPAAWSEQATSSTSSSSQDGQVAGSSSIGIRTTDKNIVGRTSLENSGEATQEEAREYSNDQQLLNRVVADLAADPRLKGASIEVRVDDGRVALSGIAADQAQADHARQVAERLAGNGKVDSALETQG